MKHDIDAATLNSLAFSTLDDLNNRHISEAIDKMSFLIQNGHDDQSRAEFEELRTNYHAMLSFLSQGGTDEHRAEIQDNIARQVWRVLQRITRIIRLNHSDDAYCKTYTLLTEQGSDAHSLMQQWSFTPPSEERLMLQDQLFDTLWTSPIWKPADATMWDEFIQRQDDLVQEHLLWAIFLSCYEYPDQEKLSLILKMAESADYRISRVAITALTFILRQHGDILSSLGILSPSMLSPKQLSIILQIEHEFALMLASQKDTERETDELDALPQDDIGETLKKAFKIKVSYIKRRVALGYDHNLTRLSLLHSSKFFSKCSHWFLPFDRSHPLAQSLTLGDDGQTNDFLSRFAEVSNDCDVDKYAMCEMINNNQVLARSMAEQMQQADLPLNNMDLPDMTLRHMMQNLYRFFTQSPICKSLPCPFHDIHMLISDQSFRRADSEELCTHCVRTLMDAEEFVTASIVLESMAQQYGASAELMILQGNCYEHRDRISEAYRCYTQAALLEEPDESLAQSLYRCSMSLKKKEEQIRWLDVLIQKQPDHVSLLFQKASFFTEEKRWKEAREVYYHILYDHSEDMEALRGIVTCEMMLQNIPAAQKYSEKLMEDPAPNPWSSRTLLGNLAFIQGDWKKAKAYYTSAAECYIREKNGTYATYLEQYEKQREFFLSNNISKVDADLMRDSLWMTFIHGL